MQIYIILAYFLFCLNLFLFLMSLNLFELFIFLLYSNSQFFNFFGLLFDCFWYFFYLRLKIFFKNRFCSNFFKNFNLEKEFENLFLLLNCFHSNFQIAKVSQIYFFGFHATNPKSYLALKKTIEFLNQHFIQNFKLYLKIFYFCVITNNSFLFRVYFLKFHFDIILNII